MKKFIICLLLITSTNLIAAVGDGSAGIAAVGDGSAGVAAVGDGSAGVAAVGDGSAGVTAVGDGSHGISTINLGVTRIGNGLIRTCFSTQFQTLACVVKRQ